MVRQYELTLILPADLETSGLDQIKKSVEDVVSKVKGKVLNLDEWGVKKLAYEIGKHDKGVYYHYTLELPSEGVAEVENKLRLNDTIIRLLLVKQEN